LKKNIKGYKIATIFISAPTTEELSHRLRERGDISIAGERLALAKKELKFVKFYDYLLINQDVEKALYLLQAVLIAERLRRVK
jgi:guanylate kinase